MKIKNTVKTETEIEMETPAFWSNDDHTTFLAVIDEKTVIKIINRESFKLVQNAEHWLFVDEIAEAYQNWNTISESEFIEIHEQFLQRLSLMPMLIKD